MRKKGENPKNVRSTQVLVSGQEGRKNRRNKKGACLPACSADSLSLLHSLLSVRLSLFSVLHSPCNGFCLLCFSSPPVAQTPAEPQTALGGEREREKEGERERRERENLSAPP